MSSCSRPPQSARRIEKGHKCHYVCGHTQHAQMGKGTGETEQGKKTYTGVHEDATEITNYRKLLKLRKLRRPRSPKSTKTKMLIKYYIYYIHILYTTIYIYYILHTTKILLFPVLLSYYILTTLLYSRYLQHAQLRRNYHILYIITYHITYSDKGPPNHSSSAQTGSRIKCKS